MTDIRTVDLGDGRLYFEKENTSGGVTSKSRWRLVSVASNGGMRAILSASPLGWIYRELIADDSVREDDVILYANVSASITLTLPLASSDKGRMLIISVGADANAAAVLSPQVGDTVFGSSGITVEDSETAFIVSDGVTDWKRVNLTLDADSAFIKYAVRAKLAAAAPTTADDRSAGYKTGDTWIDETADDSYTCMDDTNGAAVWKKTSNLVL